MEFPSALFFVLNSWDEEFNSAIYDSFSFYLL